MYNITVMDQYSPAIVTVPANMLSVQFPYNGANIVANREYTITVSAISNQGTSYPSDPVIIGKFHTGVPRDEGIMRGILIADGILELFSE